MTVKELIEKLQNCPEDNEVVVCDDMFRMHVFDVSFYDAKRGEYTEKENSDTVVFDI